MGEREEQVFGEALNLVTHVFIYHTVVWYLLGTMLWGYKDNSDMVGQSLPLRKSQMLV